MLKTKEVDLASLVLRLYSESNHHETLVRALFQMAGIDGRTEVPQGEPIRFSFDGSSERDIAEDILRMEKTAHDLYGQIE